MKRILFLFLIVSTMSYCMDDMNLDSNPQDIPPTPSVWRQVKWKFVDPDEFTLEQRLASIDIVVRRLNETNDNLLALRSHDQTYNEKLLRAVSKLCQIATDGAALRDNIIAGISKGDYDRSYAQEFADKFLNPYCQSEAALRAQVESLARESVNHDAIDNLITIIAKLQIGDSTDH